MNKQHTRLACALVIMLAGSCGQAQADHVQALPGPAEAAQPGSGAAEPVQAQPAQPEPAPAQAEPEPGTGPQGARTFPGSKYSFAPLPMEIYMLQNQKPTLVISTPCVQIEKMTHGFPPFMAFENFMFTWIGNVNESNLLPIRIEPVCI